MKKRVLFSAIALFAAGLFSAQAQLVLKSASYQPQAFGKTNGAVQAPMRAAAEGGLVHISYCGDISQVLGWGASVEVGAAIKVSSETVNALAGNQLTKIKLGLGSLTARKSIQLFLTYDLNQDPFYTQNMTSSITEYAWNEFALTTPYTIEAGKEFYIGYKVTPGSQDYVLGIDLLSTSYEGNYLYVSLQSGGNQWSSFAEYGASKYGNICIRGVVEGDHLDNYPKNDVMLSTLVAPSLVATDTDFLFQGQFVNNGLQSVNSIDVTYTVGTMAPVTKTVTFENPVANAETSIFNIEGARIDYVANNIPLKVSISKVNGVDDEKSTDNDAQTVIGEAISQAFERNVVVEERTGTWCGWCPRGIVAMEYMKNTYPETFIGIAAHNGDQMYAASYATFSGIQAAPYAIIDRKEAFDGVDPSAENLEAYYNYERMSLVDAKIALAAVYADEEKGSVNLHSTVTFSRDKQSANYRVAYVVLENQVGPYRQSNYYAGGGEGAMGGWENKASSATTYFDDVARNIFSYNGLTGSVPTTVKKDQGYDYSYTASLSNVTNTDNIELVAMLLNATSGEIVNAVKIPASAIGAFGGVADNVAANGVSITAGKGEIRIAGDCDSAEVYGIDGRLVKATAESTISVPAGLYIVKASANGKPTVAKVLVK